MSFPSGLRRVSSRRLEVEEVLDGERRSAPRPARALPVDRDRRRAGVADLVEHLPDRLDEVASEAHALAAEDDHLRIEDIDKVGDMAAEPQCRVLDHGACGGLAAGHRRGEVADVPARRRSDRARPSSGACRCPQHQVSRQPFAAALAAPPALLEIVAELAGAAARAAVQAAVGDEAGADAAAERDRGDAVPAAAVAEEMLRHGVGVGVVVDPDRHVEHVGEHHGDRHVTPAEALLLPADAVLGVDLAGDREPDPDETAAGHAGLGKEPVGDVGADPNHGLGPVVGQRQFELADDAGGEVGEHAVDAVDADLHADRQLRGVVDVERDGAAAGRGEECLALDEQSLGDQLGGDEGDGGGREADGGGERGAAHRPVAADLIEDEPAVQRPRRARIPLELHPDVLFFTS